MNKMLFGIVFSFFWSSAFIAGKYALSYLPPLSFLSLRFLLAGIIFLGAYKLFHNIQSQADQCKTEKTTIKTPFFNKMLWRDAMILGLLNYTLYIGLSYSGLRYLTPELVVLIVSTTPFVTVFAQSCISKTWSKFLWFSIFIGFWGVAIVLVSRMGGVSGLIAQLQNPSVDNTFVIGVMWVLLSVLASATGALYYQYVAYSHNAVVLTGLQNLGAGIMLLPFISLVAWRQALDAPIFIASLLYQVVLVSGVAMLMWLQLIRWFGSGYASAFHLLNPIFATLLSVWLFDIELSVSDVIGTLMVVFAMGLVSLDLAKTKKLPFNVKQT